MTTTKRTHHEWALRYGDGQLEVPNLQGGAGYWAAVRLRRDHRDAIRAGEVNADDYEPMTLVRRSVQVTTTITDWEDTRR